MTTATKIEHASIAERRAKGKQTRELMATSAHAGWKPAADRADPVTLRPIALMATAGHKSMATTNRYLHLAGVVFRDEAQALADRYRFVLTSPDLTESETTGNPPTEPIRV
jgi:hypothetical protein